jgi:3-mercaptopyruvate sulfurtransferase SseA
MLNTVLTDKPRTGESVPRFVDIPNFNLYKINELGEIFNKETNKKLSTYIGIDNYEHVILYQRGKRYRARVHRLMGKSFLGNPQVINHKDGNKSNNVLSNLERSTHSANIQHAYDSNFYNNTKKVSVIVKNKNTKIEHVCSSMRDAERYTGIDRHRIKLFIDGTSHCPNHTDYEFKINE